MGVMTAALLLTVSSAFAQEPGAQKHIKVIILAGDENCLEQGGVCGRTDGSEAVFHSSAAPIKDEKLKHVNYAVYKGAYQPGVDYDKLAPQSSGVIELGDQCAQRRPDKKKGALPVPRTPFPALALKAGYTTVLRGYFSVPLPGRYELQPGAGESAFNVTTLEGKEVYRRAVGQPSPKVASVQLEPNKRYAFKTIFFKKAGYDFRVPLTNRPHVLETVVAEHAKRWGGLINTNGGWGKRDDVLVYDGHPIHNDTKAIGRPLQVPADPEDPRHGVGPDLMFGQLLGQRFTEPVLIYRFATRHPVWYLRGSRSLGLDYLPPSSGGDPDLQGGWDVIHFNWGVWDATYRDPGSQFYKGRQTTSVEDYEQNLRTLVARLRQTGATLIYATTTPVWKGGADKPNGDVAAFNEVAVKVMKENGVLIDDLYSQVPKDGTPVNHNVHAVGNLAPPVTRMILEALAGRQRNTQPLPRVLLIGDSITGTYQAQVMKNLDGKAVVYKNPGNAEDTWNGLAKLDDWLDLKKYMLSGQEYREWVDGVKDALSHPDRVFPGYRNQGFELAGLVWFQGIADCQSDAQAGAYAKNLANLIRDVRRDLKAPSLPVVVAAVGFGGTNMNANTRKVFEAQMAVGDPEKYPEFSGSVKSIDTRQFVRSAAGHGSCYNEDAATFLEIGEAMGNAMVELIKDRD